MIEFKHSDTGSIRCPFHNQRETFTAGTIIQPTDPTLVRYSCGYVDGLAPAPADRMLASPVPFESELVAELSNRLRRLEERGMPRRIPSTPVPQTPGKKGGVAL